MQWTQPLAAIDTRAVESRNHWRCYPVELHVESAGITHRLSLGVSAPQRGCRRVAVGTGEADTAGS